jgi:hypothetical protein
MVTVGACVCFELHAAAELINVQPVQDEYIQCRFRVRTGQDCLEIVHAATLSSLCTSPRCGRWEISEDPADPGRLVLHIEWHGGDDRQTFYGSPECADFFRALSSGTREIEAAASRADTSIARQRLGGTDAVLSFVGELSKEIGAHPVLGRRFGPSAGRLARLTLWLIEVLGGGALYSTTVPQHALGAGPLPEDPLDGEERAQLLELARSVASVSRTDVESAVRAIEASLPVHSALPSLPRPGPAVPRPKRRSRRFSHSGVRSAAR